MMAGRWLPGQKNPAAAGALPEMLLVMADVLRHPTLHLLPGDGGECVVTAAATARGLSSRGERPSRPPHFLELASGRAAVMNTRSGRCRRFRDSCRVRMKVSAAGGGSSALRPRQSASQGQGAHQQAQGLGQGHGGGDKGRQVSGAGRTLEELPFAGRQTWTRSPLAARLRRVRPRISRISTRRPAGRWALSVMAPE